MARSRAHSDDDDPDVVDVDSIDSRVTDVSLATASAAVEVEDALLAEYGVVSSSQQRYVAFQQVVVSGIGFAWLPEAPRGNGADTIVERGHIAPAQEFAAALGLDEIRHGAPRRHVAAAGHGYSLGHQEIAVDREDGEQYGAYQQVVGGVFGELRDESYETTESADELEEEEIIIILMMFLALVTTFGTLDWRSLRAPPSENITDGDGIGGAASQLGMSRPAASRYIKKLEGLLFEMMDSAIYVPAPTADSEWSALVMNVNPNYRNALGSELAGLWPLLCDVFSLRPGCTGEAITESGTGGADLPSSGESESGEYNGSDGDCSDTPSEARAKAKAVAKEKNSVIGSVKAPARSVQQIRLISSMESAHAAQQATSQALLQGISGLHQLTEKLYQVIPKGTTQTGAD
ncbi:hypothetical protein PF006_g18013 [Phytophthora fragariae]|uniref:Uncharacterized protein n=1 Tax=Phytophthora fragariae TaxID=53985 RepID=A0A6A3E8A7_9STRA|nr:hypothetical protein PF009_g19984 [Phytophthora fragariae]KAE9120951.1 hypothetical protein PF006_g18013 [Phytophthora fragariae]